ncbi:MAG TPA: DUF4202 family protein [Gammaproteobacteria bacterium]
MNPLSRAQSEIRAVLAYSQAEDARHAEDTLAWLMRLKPRVSAALALAALGHDIDRVDKVAFVRRADFSNYDAFTDAHAHRAAAKLRTLLDRCGVGGDIANRACWLVRHHESGGDPDADTLRDADNLSWFRVKLPLYLEREGRVETLDRCRWGYDCLSPDARRYFAEIRHDAPRLDALLRDTVRRAAPDSSSQVSSGNTQRWRSVRPE